MGDIGLTEQQDESTPNAKDIQFVMPDDVGSDEAMDDRVLSDIQDTNQIAAGNELANEEGSHLLHRASSGRTDNHLLADADIKEVDSEFSRLNISTDDARGHKTDGLQELLQLAQEFESEEASKSKLDAEEGNFGGDSVVQVLLEQSGDINPTGSASKEDKCSHRAGQSVSVEPTEPALAELKKSAPHTLKGQIPTSSWSCSSTSSSLPKTASKTAGRVYTQATCQRREPADNGQLGAAENKKNPKNVSQRPSTTGSSRSNFTIPRPFSLATDKRASIGGHPTDGEFGGQIHKTHRLSGAFGSLPLKSSQVAKTLGSKMYVAKSIRSESIKHRAEGLEKLVIHVEPKHDEEDVVSVCSTQSGSKGPRAKASAFTNTTGFNFRCDERAEKRKEFYAKLNEKLTAKEEERNQMQEKTKEDNEAEIRMLRRSLTFKASPMPSFYQEEAPPKVELKKIPTTRAKSPKFCRRNSHEGSESGSNKFCKAVQSELEHNSTDSLQKPAEDGVKVSSKSNTGYSKRPVRRSLSKLPTERPSDPASTKDSGPRTDVTSLDSETAMANGSLVEVRESSSICLEQTNDGEKEIAHAELLKSKNKTSNLLEEENFLEKIDTAELKGIPALAVSEGLNDRAKGNSNELRKGHANTSAGNSLSTSNKLKHGTNFRPLASDNSQDPSVKANKRERLKALTPYFRKRESGVNMKQSGSNQVVALNVGVTDT